MSKQQQLWLQKNGGRAFGAFLMTAVAIILIVTTRTTWTPKTIVATATQTTMAAVTQQQTGPTATVPVLAATVVPTTPTATPTTPLISQVGKWKKWGQLTITASIDVRQLSIPLEHVAEEGQSTIRCGLDPRTFPLGGKVVTRKNWLDSVPRGEFLETTIAPELGACVVELATKPGTFFSEGGYLMVVANIDNEDNRQVFSPEAIP